MRSFLKGVSGIIIIIVVITLVSAVTIPIIVWSSEILCNISSSFSLNSLMTIIFDRNFELKDIITWVVAIINILITGIFSFFLWKATIKSNRIAESLNNSEKRRDERIVEKSAATVYYDILNIMYTIIEAFKSQQKSPDKMILKSDISLISSNNKWAEDIVQINGYFSAEEIDLINFIYRESDRLQANIKITEGQTNEIHLDVDKLFNRTLLFDVSQYTYLIYRTNIYEKLFSTTLRILLEKLYVVKENTKDMYNHTKEKYLQGSYGKKFVIYSSYDRFYYGDIIDNGSFKKVNWDGFLFYSHSGFQLRSYFEGKYKQFKTSFKREFISNIGLRIAWRAAIKNKRLDKDNLKTSVIDFYAALFKTILCRLKKAKRKNDRKKLENNAQEATIYKIDEENGAMFQGGKYQQGTRLEVYDNDQPWYELREGSDDMQKEVTLFTFIDKKPGALGHNSFYKNLEGRTPEFKGKIREGRFNDGEGTIYFWNGCKKFNGVIKDSKYITGTEYDIASNIIAEGEYDDKQRIYTGRAITISGAVTEESKYENGKKTYQKTTIKDKDESLVIEYNEGDISKGKGMQCFKNRVWYEGEFSGRDWHGMGVEYNDDRSIRFEGNFFKSKYEGYGKLYQRNDENEYYCMFEGVFCGGRMKDGQAQRLPIQIANVDKNKKKCEMFSCENDVYEDNEYSRYYYYGSILDYEPSGEGMIEEINRDYQCQFFYEFNNGFYNTQEL